MTSQINRFVSGVLALITAVAVIDVSNLHADAFDEGDVVATTCGAGMLTQCGQAPVVTCDWGISVTSYPGVAFVISLTSCHTTGYVPTYKDNERGSYVFGPSCAPLSPLMALPSGSGCSE